MYPAGAASRTFNLVLKNSKELGRADVQVVRSSLFVVAANAKARSPCHSDFDLRKVADQVTKRGFSRVCSCTARLIYRFVRGYRLLSSVRPADGCLVTVSLFQIRSWACGAIKHTLVQINTLGTVLVIVTRELPASQLETGDVMCFSVPVRI